MSLDLDSQDEAPQIDVTVGGHKVTVDLVQAHTACVVAPARENKKITVEELIPAIREYLARQVPEQIAVTDTQACRFYWFLVERMGEFEKKVLPASMQRLALPISSESTPGGPVL